MSKEGPKNEVRDAILVAIVRTFIEQYNAWDAMVRAPAPAPAPVNHKRRRGDDEDNNVKRARR